MTDADHTDKARTASALLWSVAMKRRRSPDDGNYIYQPAKRPHHRGNPLQNPLVLSGELSPWNARFRTKARQRVEFYPVDVREIRRQFGLNRGQFARMIGISRETLRNWERGRRWPTGPARALLRIAQADPDVVAAVLVRNRADWLRVEDP